MFVRSAGDAQDGLAGAQRLRDRFGHFDRRPSTTDSPGPCPFPNPRSLAVRLFRLGNGNPQLVLIG